jgi:hypothetical protein
MIAEPSPEKAIKKGRPSKDTIISRHVDMLEKEQTNIKNQKEYET